MVQNPAKAYVPAQTWPAGQAVTLQASVLFMSGYIPDLAGPGQSLPANTGLVQKPFTERALLEAVRTAIATPCGAPEPGVS